MIHILAIDDEPLILETIELAFPEDKSFLVRMHNMALGSS